jgi:type IV conjugative transfer system protein TraL
MEKEIPEIPRFLSQPDRVAFWTWNEVSLFVSIAAVIGIAYSIIFGFLVGVLGVHIMRSLQNSPQGDLTKVGLYWFSPWSSARYKSIPPSHIREFVG